MNYLQRLACAIGLIGLVTFAGCSNENAKSPTLDTRSDKKGAIANHEHGGTPHGGVLVEWGGGVYHAEFVIDRDKTQATVYVLDGDATKGVPIKADTVFLHIKDPTFQVGLKPMPQDGDPKDTSSRFVGTHEKLGTVQEFAGTISVNMNGKPYTGEFEAKAHGHVKNSPVDSREAKVFLTAGGIYTKADIDKNGNTVPSVKFKGIFWSHDDNLKAGDKVCPVTDNKADPQCSWWVNGQRYEFCCPPCLEKFVKWAKESPEKVKAPEFYVKK
jgi:hypothetical protein